MDVPVFAVLDAGATVDDDGNRLPTVVIDASESPAVADLARVHAIDGIGDVRTVAMRTEDVVLLGVAMTVPVRASFAIAFDLERLAGFLREVAAAGALVIAHTDPERAADERPNWLAIDIDGPALTECLTG